MTTGTATLELPTQHLAGPFSGDKVLWHGDALRSLREGQIPPPIVVELDLTNACDLRCPYCTNADHISSARNSLPVGLVEDILHDLAQMGTKAVTFTGGGEPLCHKHFPYLLQEAQRRGLETALITNGTQLQRLQSHFRILLNCKWIRVSVDAHNRESYQLSKGKDTGNEVFYNISILTRAKLRMFNNVRGEGATIGMGYITTENNLGGIPEAAKLFATLGVDYIQFRPATFMPDDPRKDDWKMGGDVMKYIERAREYEREDYKIYASMPKYKDIENPERRNYNYCSGVYFACVIGATGEVWICCHMRGYPRYSLGNVKERPFFDIWNDAVLRNEVHGRIGDFRDCMPLCRFHGQNELLAKLNWHPEHENFL